MIFHVFQRDVKKPIGASLGMMSKKIRDSDEMAPPPAIGSANSSFHSKGMLLGGDWDVTKEYDPLWPNDYEKIMMERKEKKEKEKELERIRMMEEREKKRLERYERNNNPKS